MSGKLFPDSLDDIIPSNYALQILHWEVKRLTHKIEDPLKHDWKKPQWKRQRGELLDAIDQLVKVK